jgi:hypothetical protein
MGVTLSVVTNFVPMSPPVDSAELFLCSSILLFFKDLILNDVCGCHFEMRVTAQGNDLGGAGLQASGR